MKSKLCLLLFFLLTACVSQQQIKSKSNQDKSPFDQFTAQELFEQFFSSEDANERINLIDTMAARSDLGDNYKLFVHAINDNDKEVRAKVIQLLTSKRFLPIRVAVKSSLTQNQINALLSKSVNKIYQLDNNSEISLHLDLKNVVFRKEYIRLTKGSHYVYHFDSQIFTTLKDENCPIRSLVGKIPYKLRALSLDIMLSKYKKYEDYLSAKSSELKSFKNLSKEFFELEVPKIQKWALLSDPEFFGMPSKGDDFLVEIGNELYVLKKRSEEKGYQLDSIKQAQWNIISESND